jgi:hypothetical protein
MFSWFSNPYRFPINTILATLLAEVGEMAMAATMLSTVGLTRRENRRTISAFLFLIAFNVQVFALTLQSPKPTPAGDGKYSSDGWTPMPTSPPEHELLRRQTAALGTTICGYTMQDGIGE